jgi:hypothetical protein
VLHALVAGYWERPDLGLDAIPPLDPDAAAAAITDPIVQRETRELMVLLEACRHPLTEAQVERVDVYGATLHQDGHGDDGKGMALLRDFVRGGAAQAMADYQRYIVDVRSDISEPSLVAEHVGMGDAPEPELAVRLRAMHDLPAGTLGYEYAEFYRRNGLTLPGDDPSMPAVFVSHDMCHVIAGYEPTGPEEIALGAMQLCIADNDDHWVQFLGNLAVHEAGFFSNEAVTGKTATMARAGSAELVAEAMRRGSACTGDFTAADHLALADVPLAEVRARFGVPARST